MRPETLKMLIVIALYRGWAIRQWHMVVAYLQANLHHDVYISDINEEEKPEYWKLNKALCGLKHGGHEWFKKLCGILAAIRLKQCVADEGCYKSMEAIIGTHVDDLLGIAPSEADLDPFKQLIEETLELEKRGKPVKMLAMELTWKQNEVILTQQLLIETTCKTYLLQKKNHGGIGKKCSRSINEALYKPPDPEFNEVLYDQGK